MRGKGASAVEEIFLLPRLYWKSAVLFAGLRLNVFELLQSPQTAAYVANVTESCEASMTLLLNALVSLKILEKAGENYSNSTVARAFLTEGSEMSMKLVWLHLADQWGSWGKLSDAVRLGSPVLALAANIDRPSDQAEEAHPDAHYVPCSIQISKLLAREFVRKIDLDGVKYMLDVGGGAGGNFSLAVCKTVPGARAVILDLPATIKAAEDAATESWQNDRIEYIAGDARRDDFGTGYDLVLMSLFIHVFPADVWKLLIAKAYRALVPSGRVAINEYLLEENRAEPEFSTLYALYGLVNFRGGYVATTNEVESWMTDAGFKDVQQLDLYRGLKTVIGTKGT
jgi:ubiquinone/menaquinone biosynthesis C-methylase UbiE